MANQTHVPVADKEQETTAVIDVARCWQSQETATSGRSMEKYQRLKEQLITSETTLWKANWSRW